MSTTSAPWAPRHAAEDYLREETYRATRGQVESARTLIPEAYFSEEFFAVEQQRIWQRSWVAVGYDCQLRNVGDVLTCDIAGQPIIVVRDRAGSLQGFYNVCRHRGSRLVCEDTNCKVIRCPYHGWGYSLDGKLLGTPYFKGLDVPPELAAKFQIENEAAGFSKDDYPLLPVAVEQWGGMVFVNLDPAAHPFADWVGDLPTRFARHPLADLQLVRRQTFEIKANWKLIAENFMEYYHLPWGHPELCNVSGFDNHYRCQGPGMYTGICTVPLSSDPSTVSFDLPALPGLNTTESQSAYFILQFPNIALWMFPHHFLTLLYRPSSAGVTIEHLDMLVHPDALQQPDCEATFDRIFAFWKLVNDQDIRLVENMQIGLRARAYAGGRLCYKFEEPVHRFQNMVIDLMTGNAKVPAGDAVDEIPVLGE